MNKTERIIDLLFKQTFEELTAEEEKELFRLQLPPATEAQKDYIEELLMKLGATLADYDIEVDIDDLTAAEASELIDQLKDDVTDADAWED